MGTPKRIDSEQEAIHAAIAAAHKMKQTVQYREKRCVTGNTANSDTHAKIANKLKTITPHATRNKILWCKAMELSPGFWASMPISFIM
jgi:hypothetical protein